MANARAIEKTHYLLEELHNLLAHDPLMFEFFQDGLLDGIWYWDLENIEHEWMSPKLWLTLGYEPSEKAHLASEWQEIIFQEHSAIAQHNFKCHLADPNQPYDQYVRYRHKCGQTIWIRCRGIAIHDSKGKAIRFLGGHVDVTNLMERQEALMAENSKFHQVEKRLAMLELESVQLKAENDYLKKHNLSLLKYERESCIATKGYFSHRAKEWFYTANRLGMPINIMSVAITNSQEIITIFGEVELINKTISLSELIHDLVVDMIVCKSGSNTLLGISLGLSSHEAQQLNDSFIKKIKQKEWSIIAPEVKVHIGTHYDVDPTDESLLDRLLINASQFTTL